MLYACCEFRVNHNVSQFSFTTLPQIMRHIMVAFLGPFSNPSCKITEDFSWYALCYCFYCCWLSIAIQQHGAELFIEISALHPVTGELPKVGQN